MPTARSDRGADWERAARAHLERAGLVCLAANVRYRLGELDLVMLDGGCVVFVEVRYRRSGAFGGGAASVDASKRRKFVLAARSFLAEHPALAQRPCRFDVIAADGTPASPRLDWIRSAFTLDDNQGI